MLGIPKIKAKEFGTFFKNFQNQNPKPAFSKTFRQAE